MDRISPSLLLFSLLLSLLVTALLGMLWTSALALGRLWKGLPVLAEDYEKPLRPAPWGSVTVAILVVLYLGVNISVSRIYAAVTGRHLPRTVKPAENPVRPSIPGKETDPSKHLEPSRPGEDEANASSKEQAVAAGGPGREAAEQTLTELMFQSALSNCLLLFLVPGFLRMTRGVHWPTLACTVMNGQGR